MCGGSPPDDVPEPKQLARSRKPNQAALLEEARVMASGRGTGRTRNNILTSLSGIGTAPALAAAGRGRNV